MEIGSLLSQTAAGGTSSAAADSNRLSGDFDQFLTLLTTQLQHQDPLEPLDSNEFVNQLVSFSQVEQAIKSNKQLESLLAMQTTGQAMGALSYIGHTVEAEGEVGPLADGKAEFIYGLPEQAAKSTVGVFDASGTMVYSAEGETGTGRHAFVWNGKDGNGNQLPDGVYRFGVFAKNADGADITVSKGVVGKVTGVQTTADGVVLSLGGASVAIDKVFAVRETQTAAQ